MNKAKLISIRILLLVVCMFYSNAIKAYDFENDGLYYNILSNNQVEVTYMKKTDRSYAGKITIPEKVKYGGKEYIVSAIGDLAFWMCDGLTGSLKLPQTITSIGELAFHGCSGFVGTLNIPNSVKTIGQGAFSESSFTGSLTIPNSVISIGPQAFYNCKGFSGDLILSNSMTTVESSTFNNCTGFSGQLVIPNSIQSIKSAAFAKCGFTGTLSIPNSVVSIESQAFASCEGFVGSLTLPSSITKIGSYAFANCMGLTGSLIIPNSVNIIEDYAFERCGFTGSLTIPNSVKSIGDFAFNECLSFRGSLIISDALTSIGVAAFQACGFTGSLTIPNSVTSIGDGAFNDCRGFSGSLIIPSSVTLIGMNPFSACNGITNIIVNSGNTRYDSRNGCNAIIETSSNTLIAGCKNTAIPSSVTSIGSDAFSLCSDLASITIPSSVTSIGSHAFMGCSSLVLVRSLIEVPYTIDNNVFYGIIPAKLEVPKGTKSKYQALSGWANHFKEIVEIDDNSETYTLSIAVSGNGSATYDGVSIKDETKSFTVAEGGNATITLSPDDGYKVNISKIEGNYSSNLNDNTLTISNIKSNLTVEIEFLAIPSYTLSIKALGNGSVTYDGAVIRDKTSSFTVKKGASAKITFTPDNGYQIKTVKVNGSTVSVNNNEYTISSISKNTTVEVEFVGQLNSFEYEGVNYNIVSMTDRIVYVAAGDYGKVLEVPWHVYYQDMGWYVDGVEDGAFDNNPDLAAIIWHPDTTFKGQVSNPNLLLYVSKEHFAPNNINNVVVNGTANSITLTDAASGNNFYCPQEFTAKTISYTHHYWMQTGIGKAQGWETIALPFDVQKVTHESKGEIVSFANWRSGDAKKPFWLMQLSGSGWTMTGSIKANTPYIISMPNNPEYKSGFLLNGSVTFSAENVTIPKTENLIAAKYGDRTFVPTFSSVVWGSGVLALNVVNGIERNTNGETEGSTFVLDLRPVHPFEAYMTSTSSTRSIGIDEGMATGIMELISAISDDGVLKIYNLNGQLVKIEEGGCLDEVMKNLPAGVYIVNGKKMIIR